MTINALTPTTTASSSASRLGMEDLLKVLLTQLTYQDPLKPMDNEQFMAQIAQFTTLQQTQEMNNNLAQLLANQASLQSVGLIGRTVDITTDTGTVTGTVVALSLAGDSPKLSVRTTAGATLNDIDLSRIAAVR